MLANFRLILESAWSKESFSVPGHFAASGLFTKMLSCIFIMIAPVLLTIVATAVILNLVQMKGFILSFKALRMSFGNLNPFSGLRRMFSLRSLTELVKSIFKMAIVSYAVYSVLWPERVAHIRAGRAGGIRFFEPYGNARSQAPVSGGWNHACP